MLSRFARHAARLVLVALLAGLLPSARLLGTLPALAAVIADDPAPPVELTVPPVADPHLPSLTLHLDVALQRVTVGETASFTLTLTNQADDSADDLTISLPTPDSATALAGPNTLGAAQGWLWDLDRLDPRATTTLTGQLLLNSSPSGDALLLHAQASAKGLDTPIYEVGGTLVRDSSPAPAIARYLPGAPTSLSSPDGRV
jgi:uncharacterized repeat protein (TIGR01451 family)